MYELSMPLRQSSLVPMSTFPVATESRFAIAVIGSTGSQTAVDRPHAPSLAFALGLACLFLSLVRLVLARRVLFTLIVNR